MSRLLTAQELRKRIDSDDRRCTAEPYLLLLRRTRRVPTPPKFCHHGESYIEQVSGNYTEFDSYEDACKWLQNDSEYKIKDEDIEKVCYLEVEETINVFLTDEGYKDHAEENGHNLGDHNNYAIHAFRNREIESLYSLIDQVIKLEKENEKLKKIGKNKMKCEVCNKDVERLSRLKMPSTQGRIKYICADCLDELDDYQDRKIAEKKENKHE